MTNPNAKFEKDLLKQYKYICGVDEVGVGCLAGPVVACAVLLDKKTLQKIISLDLPIRDSKQISAKQRETITHEIKKQKIKYCICYSLPRTIDRLNIYQVSRSTMKRAVKKALQLYSSKALQLKTMVLVDGPRELDKLPYTQKAIIKGDSKVFSIAIASIIAKVFRDKMMGKYAKKYPQYGFERHKGYGTTYHVAQLALYGSTKIHRVSFAPVTKVL